MMASSSTVTLHSGSINSLRKVAMFDLKLYFEIEFAVSRVGNSVCVCFDTTTVLVNARVRSHLT